MPVPKGSLQEMLLSGIHKIDSRQKRAGMTYCLIFYSLCLVASAVKLLFRFHSRKIHDILRC